MIAYPTITIGIPAYNEASTIAGVLRSILSQKGDFTLAKIIVVSDGSTDGTANVVRTLICQHPIIELWDDSQRRGKTARLNGIYHASVSDYIFTFDADVLLEGTGAIQAMLDVFHNDPGACLVVAHQVPIKPTTFLGRVIWAGNILWDDTRTRIRGGDSVHNVYGAASALRADFARSVTFPHAEMCDTGYLYAVAKRWNGFRYAFNARVYYRLATTLHDFRLQGSRALFHDKNILRAHLGKDVNQLYDVPLSCKLIALSRAMVCDPFYSILSIGLGAWVRLFPLHDVSQNEGIWEPVRSTKIPIPKN